jgi:uncharacterized membrane protein required for colicin V production
MLFWVGILIAGLFAWYAVRAGFYEIWAMLFNIVVSIYLAVFLGPVILHAIPGAGDTALCNVLAMITTAAAVFLILHCISYSLMVGQFTVTFPRIIGTLGSALLGFVAGFLIWSFLCLLVFVSPASQDQTMQQMGFDSKSCQTATSYVSWWCNLVHRIAAPAGSTVTSQEAIENLLQVAEKQAQEKEAGPNDANEPTSSKGAGDLYPGVRSQASINSRPPSRGGQLFAWSRMRFFTFWLGRFSAP